MPNHAYRSYSKASYNYLNLADIIKLLGTKTKMLYIYYFKNNKVYVISKGSS